LTTLLALSLCASLAVTQKLEGVKAEKMSTDSINFETVKNEEIFSESSNVTVESVDLGMSQTYYSPEAKKRQEYKFYNNTNIYVTFRKNHVPLSENGGAKHIFQVIIMDELKKEQN
jgi:putative alpha-1,2-mannosidase